MSERVSTNPFLSGNFAPVMSETTAFDLPVVGAIPDDLNGRLLRIGPNPVDPDPATYFWFMGHGMAHGLQLSGGRAEWYRSRWVVSDNFAGKRGLDALPGPRNGSPATNPNTNIITLDGRTFAIVEAGGLPIELTDELESVAWSNLKGTLAHGFAAHPKLDPVTGELQVLTYQPGQNVAYLVVAPDGRARTVAEIPLPHAPMVHDTAFTSRFVILLDFPVAFDKSLSGYPYAWNDTLTPRIGLIPRNGDIQSMRWIEAPTDCFVFHVMNAFDDGDQVVIDVVRHGRMFDRAASGGLNTPTRLVRWRIDLATGRLTETTLFDRACEFPRFNDLRGGLPYRYGYTAGGDGAPGPLHKHDVETATTITHDFGAGRHSLEPVFVPRSGARDEDDGYVMAYIYDEVRDASEVVILDAQAFDEPPLATVRLPARVPYGFHGNWCPNAANRLASSAQV